MGNTLLVVVGRADQRSGTLYQVILWQSRCTGFAEPPNDVLAEAADLPDQELNGRRKSNQRYGGSIYRHRSHSATEIRAQVGGSNRAWKALADSTDRALQRMFAVVSPAKSE